VALSALPARAHMMPAGQATLNVLEDAVFEVVSVPVSAVASAGADEDHDGRLSDREVAAHEAALVSQVVSRFKLFDGEREGTLELSIVRSEADDRDPATAAGAQQLLALLKTRFPAPPRALRVETDLFGTTPDDQHISVRATRGADKETARLDSKTRAHVFFAPAPKAVVDAPAATSRTIAAGFGALVLLAAGFGFARRARKVPAARK
jgi:hypothetical protein